MATTDIVPQESAGGLGRKRIVNDFSIQVATVNGSGSQSSNTVLLRTIFQMGVPVSGKNMFPSNIAGLPTWFTIRASKDGYIARKKEIDFLVAMNPETAQEDVMTLAPGAAVLYDEPLKLNKLRTDLTFYAVPYDKLVAAVCPEAKLRKLVRNMIYVGVVAQLLGIDMAEVEKALRKQFAKKAKAANLNWAAAKAGYDYADSELSPSRSLLHRAHEQDRRQDHHRRQLRRRAGLHVRRRHGGDLVSDHAVVVAGARRMIDYMKEYRIGPDGKATFAIVQAEDELAAIGMVLGAGWAGARSMTATAGPGISLMAEFVGLGYYAEVPGVIWDIQRVGPSTGLPTRTSQGDILSTAFLSHGDTKHIMLIPSFARRSASRMAQRRVRSGRAVPDAGVRHVRSRSRHEQLDVRSVRVSRQAHQPRQGADARKIWTGSAVSRATKTWTATAFGYRTLPGTDHPAAAYFTRGSGHNEKAQYSERADDYENNMDRLARKFETARTFVPRPEITKGDTANGPGRSASSPTAPRTGRIIGKPRPASRRVRHRDRLSAAARVSVHPRGARLHRAARARLRGRAEPRRADAAAC